MPNATYPRRLSHLERDVVRAALDRELIGEYSRYGVPDKTRMVRFHEMRATGIPLPLMGRCSGSTFHRALNHGLIAIGDDAGDHRVLLIPTAYGLACLSRTTNGREPVAPPPNEAA